MGPIAILGAGGFVGTRLVETLLLGGASEVKAIVRSYRSFASLARFGSPLTITLADAENPAALAQAIQGCSAVVNLTTGTPASIQRSTRAIVQACSEAKVPRFIHMSSAVVYGEVSSPDLADDAPPLSKHWMPYAKAKSAAEVFLRQRQPSLPFQLSVLRPGIVWGPRSQHTLHIVNGLLSRSAWLVDQGQGICNTVYVDNLVAGILACCVDPGDISGFYNVGDAETITWRDFYAAFAEHCAYDMNRALRVSGDSFPWSLRSAIDYVQNFPGINALYHIAKTKLPDGLKASIKARLAGQPVYDSLAQPYAQKPSVDRELWHLQKVQYKLPIAKFQKRFGFKPPVSFEQGARRACDWLSFLGHKPVAAKLARST